MPGRALTTKQQLREKRRQTLSLALSVFLVAPETKTMESLDASAVSSALAKRRDHILKNLE